MKMAMKEQDVEEHAVKGLVRNDSFAIFVSFVGVAGLISVSAYALYLGDPLIASITALASAAIVTIRAITSRRG